MEKGKWAVIQAKRIFVALLRVKRNVMELGPPPQFQPKQGASYQPPSLPQLIFHFSSRAHRMRDVSISCQSFPGLCVTCVVISVWLTGSVVSHCPAPSDSHRLTLMMSRGEGPVCSGTTENRSWRRVYLHTYNDEHKSRAHTNTSVWNKGEGYSAFVTTTQSRHTRDHTPS